MLIAQITDCHIVDPGSLMADRIDSAATLSAVVGHLNAMSPRPDVVVATGDLVNDGRPSQYDRLEAILGDLAMPFVPLPGNHDDRTELRRRFRPVLPSGGPDEPIDHVLDLGPVRLVFLDTQIPGRVGGRLSASQLTWLDRTLGEAPQRPTLLFQHHPPFPTGISFMDADAFQGTDAFAAVIARHRQVEIVSCGHLHRSIARRFAGTIACTWPSTCAQIDLVLDGGAVRYVDESPAVVFHLWAPMTGVRSHLQTVGDHERWTPAWATRTV